MVTSSLFKKSNVFYISQLEFVQVINTVSKKLMILIYGLRISGVSLNTES